MTTLLEKIVRSGVRPVWETFKMGLEDLDFLLAGAVCDFCQVPLLSGDHRRICRACIDRVTELEISYEKHIHNAPLGFMKKFPYLCKICSHPLASRKAPCWLCKRNPLKVKKLYTLFFNAHHPQDFFYRYKFRRYTSYKILLQRWILERLSPYLKSYDVCVPLTLSYKETLRRDFCPVGTVIRPVMKKLGIPIIPAIKRIPRQTEAGAQHFKTLLERRRDAAGRFYAHGAYKGALSGKRIILVDDIYTTGSTLNVAADLILEHNAPLEMVGLTFLRSILEKSPAEWLSYNTKVFDVKPGTSAILEENWTFFT